MVTRTELKIFTVFAREPFREYTRKDLKKRAKEKSNNSLARVINSLKSKNVLIEKKIGRTGLLSLNLNEELTYTYISLSSHKKIPSNIEATISSLINEITNITPFCAIVVFGSYALGKQKKDSDIDIAVFIDDETKKHAVESAVNRIKLKTVFEMDVHIIPKKEMKDMLTTDEENLGKQIARKHIAVYNNRIFYEMIKKGEKHGFSL